MNHSRKASSQFFKAHGNSAIIFDFHKKRAEPACISATVRKDSKLYAREQALCNFL